jgi:hypothetical protein
MSTSYLYNVAKVHVKYSARDDPPAALRRKAAIQRWSPGPEAGPIRRTRSLLLAKALSRRGFVSARQGCGRPDLTAEILRNDERCRKSSRGEAVGSALRISRTGAQTQNALGPSSWRRCYPESALRSRSTIAGPECYDTTWAV